MYDALLKFAADAAVRSYGLSGELYLSKSGWLLLHVPNQIGHGAFKALHEPGIEQPLSDTDGKYNAHISVMNADEITQIGGPEKITERGKSYAYSLGNIKEFEPKGWSEMERCWALEIHSPELEQLRKSYGLSPIPGDGKIKFHITVAVRRRKVLGNNEISKAAPDPIPREIKQPNTIKLHDRPGVHLIKASLQKRANFQEALYALLEPKVRQWVESKGMKLGPFTPRGNILDHLKEQQHRDLQTMAMQGAAKGDPSPLRIMKGLHAALGRPWDPSMDQQAKTLQEGFAEITPFLMRWSPNFWDQMHGGTGSVASLAAAIADANKYHNMDAPTAVNLAEQVFKDMYSDPMKHRGFSARQLGQIYQEALKRGYVSRAAKPEQIAEQLAPVVGATSAVRDTALSKGIDVQDIPAMWLELDKSRAAMPYRSFGDIETQIRSNRQLQLRGGLMGQSLDRAGVQWQPQMGDRRTLEARNDQLMQQAAESPLMDMVSATQRAINHGLVSKDSPAGQFVQQSLDGNMPYMRASDWMNMMASSGMSRFEASTLLKQRATNSRFITPELTAGVRMAQPTYDHARSFANIERRYPGNSPAMESIRRGAREQEVVRRGYSSLPEYEALQGPARANIGATLADSNNRAKVESSMSGMGWRGPIARVSDALKEPEPSATSLGNAFLNVMPEPKESEDKKLDPSYDPEHPEECCPHCGARLERGDDGKCNRCGEEWPMEKKAIVGIPDRNDYGDLSQLKPEQIVDLVIQKHRARLAGLHRDVRLGTPELGLYSWATKAEGLPKPGEKKYISRQPQHSHAFGSFQGTIGKGYGRGEVRRQHKGRILITHASPTKVEFTTASSGTPERFVLFKPEKWGARDWLMMNVTPTEGIPYEKPHYKTVPAEKVEAAIDKMQKGTSYQAKIDGANTVIKLMSNGAEVLSYRQSKRTGGPIFHTERVFKNRPKFKVPRELQGSILRGELYGTQGDRVMPPQETGGLLNATLEHSIQQQKQKQTQLRDMLFDIQQYGRKKIDPNKVPYEERRRMLEEALKILPPEHFELSEQTTDPEEGKQLWRQIREGKHPKTREGLVMMPPTGTPIKSKIFDEHDVHITGVFPGEGKYKGRGAGGFTYALEKNGPEVGRVGTGISDQMRELMWQDPQAYIGRVARIRAQEQHPSGAYRVPALLAFHEDI